jgi:N-acetylmuramoyl-L-alanine amidase-like protein
MRKRFLTLLAACVAALVVVAAPALSLRPYQPEPVDFEVAPDATALLAGGAGGRVVSRPLRAPKRFNLVGLRWRGRADPRVAIRTRRSGGGWSRWENVTGDRDHAPDPGSHEPQPGGVSDPAWAGEADYVQYRMSRRVPGLRIHFVNSRGTATRGSRLLSAIRRSANAGMTAIGGLVTDAVAADSQPRIHRRRDWNSSDCPPRRAPSYGRIKVGFVHHTASTDDYSPEDVPAIVLGICRFHRNSNGWDDIGYNFLVDKFGGLWEGRAGGMDKPVAGAQVAGFNYSSFGVSNIGDFTGHPQTDVAMRSLARLIRWKLPLHGVPTSGSTLVTSSSGNTIRLKRISGHRDANATGCPGDRLYAQLPALREMVGGVVPDERGTRLRAIFRPDLITSGRRARVAVRLRRASGTPVPRARILIERRRRGRWSKVGSVRTNGEGFARTRIRMSVTRRLRAHFRHTSALRGAFSPSKVIEVKPRFAFERKPPREVDAGERVRVPGRIKPRKSQVLLVIQRFKDGVYRRVALTKVRVRRGRFTARFTMRRTGRHRFYVVFPGDDFNARGRTHRYRFDVVAPSGPAGGGGVG